jgi:hypothetical protein
VPANQLEARYGLQKGLKIMYEGFG